ncbi:MAG: RND family efflux transporter MFP subunit [Alphaproteobacteria bacterium]|jgi:RND family efflux transporter MFP subunit
MKNIYKTLAVIAVATALIGLPLLYASDDDDTTETEVAEQEKPSLPEATVKLAEVVEQIISPEIFIPGTVVSRNDAKIATEVAGLLLSVAEVGTKVAKGGVLAKLDDRLLKFQLDDNNASIFRLKASLKYSQQQVEQLTSLSQSNNTAKTQIDQAISQRDMATQELARAKVSKAITLYQLERTLVRAPFPGQVVERYQQAGEFSNIGGQLIRLVDTVNVEISAQAPVKIAPQLVDNMAVTLVYGNKTIAKTVRSIISVGDERSRNFELRIAAPEGTWVVGAAIKVSLPTEQARNVVSVPRDALILRQDSIYLFKINDNETATRILVKTGIGKGNSIEVIGDISSGDRVVIRGGERLREGQPVKEKITSTGP